MKLETQTSTAHRRDAVAAIATRMAKKTDIGEIASDWIDLALQDLTQDTSPICYGIVQVGRYVQNGVKVLAIKNLGRDYATNIHRAAATIEQPYARSRVQPGDVVISVKGTTGRIGLIPAHFHGNISRDLARIRPKSDISSAFLFHALQSYGAQARLAAATVGTTRMELSIAILKQVKVPIPPSKVEQDAIASALSHADALIDALEDLIAKKRAIKDGATDELLSGRRRLEWFKGGKSSQSFVQTEAGMLPADWHVEPVEAFATIATGGRNTQDRVEDGAYPFFVRSQTIERINTYSFDGEAVLTAGDGVGTGRIFHYINGRCDIHQRVYRISDFRSDVNGYYFYLFFSANFYSRIMQMTAKSSVDSVRREMIALMLVALPPRKEQDAIAQVLSEMEDELEALNARLAKARQIKRGMMQELLTGRVRLI